MLLQVYVMIISNFNNVFIDLSNVKGLIGLSRCLKVDAFAFTVSLNKDKTRKDLPAQS